MPAAKSRSVRPRADDAPRTISDAARELGIGRSTLHRWISQGVAKTFRFGNRPRISAAEIERLKGLQPTGKI
jgi:excisionase family DNA binding protein